MKKIIFGIILLFIGFETLYCQLAVHGYLSQAFAVSDSYQIFGIPKDGTTDYRTLALQFRYDIDEHNSSIIQFSHRRIGKSPLMNLENDVVLDWAFFEHRFNENFGFKAGKILVPFGLYNEIRDVGVLLPFYRPPYTPYTMGSYLSETVNGAAVFYNQVFDDWEFNLDVYGGSWQWKLWFNQPFGDPVLDVSMVDNAIGAKGSIFLPEYYLSGGASWQRGDVIGSYFFGDLGGVGAQSFNIINLYMDYNCDLFYVRPEYTITMFNQGDFYIDGISVIAGLDVFYDISANFAFETLNIHHVPKYAYPTSKIIIRRDNSNYLKDIAVGLNYRFNSNVILKSEMHFNKSLAVEDVFVNVFSDKPKNIKFFILSLATSF